MNPDLNLRGSLAYVHESALQTKSRERFNHFCRAHGRDQHTHRRSDHAIGRIYIYALKSIRM